MDATDVYSRSGFLNATLRDLLVRADHVTACSAETLRDLEQFRAEELGSRGTVIWNGIAPEDVADPAVEAHRHRRPYMLALGRLVPQKGFDLLIDAFAIATRDRFFDHDLLIAGTGPEHDSVRRRVGDAGLEDRVHLLGAADRTQVVSLFRGSSFFVLPSRHEPFGIVDAEAMAAARAIVATAVGGVPEIVEDGANGLLVEPHADHLAQAIARLAADSELRDRLGRAGSTTGCWRRR